MVEVNEKFIKILVSVVLSLYCVCYLFMKENALLAQSYENIKNNQEVAKDVIDSASINNRADEIDSYDGNHKPNLATLAMLIGVPVGTLIYGMATWDWGEEKSFHVRYEGFFGQNTANGGADKVGHAFSHYIAFRALHYYYDWSENGSDSKWYYSITTAVSLGLLIEVGDAYSSEYGFSYEDFIADLSGISLGILLEYSPTLDSLIGTAGNTCLHLGIMPKMERSLSISLRTIMALNLS
ncbi:MAG: YfiM family protein [Spirochaetes bacterium]|nr:YfiM family protein [Spirochaetota bacterium]